MIVPADPTYEAARAVWNGMIDRRPALIVRPTGAADVITAVRFARDEELPIAVRGGGHSIPGFSTCDGGIVIDLSRMRGVARRSRSAASPASAAARCSASSTHEAQAFGLVCPVGVVSHTGVAGLTLGGGMGRLQRKLGLTIDNLLSVDIVTADGRLVHASEDENPDLFWGMRGAGANFGIATSLEYRLHPFDRVITYGSRSAPGRAARSSRHCSAMPSRTDPTSSGSASGSALDGTTASRSPTSTCCTAGSLADADRDLATLRAFGSPVGRSIVPKPT